MKRFLKNIFSINSISLTLCATFLVVILLLTGIPFLDLMELKTYDLRFLSRGRLEPSPAIVMAVIDEKSLDTEGRWPWPRSKIAKLVDMLSQDGAKVIGFDIGFLEADENSHSDLALASAIKGSSAMVILGYFFHMSEDALNYRIDKEEIDQRLEQISPSKYPLIIYEDQNMEIFPFIKSFCPEVNLEILTKATKYSGYFNMLPDKDGVLRWMPIIIECGEDIFPPLSLLCAWHYLDQPQLMVKVAAYGVEGIQMGERFIPTDENGVMLINYLGPPKTFPHFSISDILHGRIPDGTFKDKIVLVGPTAVGIYDLRNSPFSPIFPGVEFHATIIDNILKQRFINRPEWARTFDLLAIIILGVITGMMLPRLSALMGLFSASGLFILYILIARWLFVSFGIWLNIVYPLLVLSITYSSLTVYHYMTEERERRKIKMAFSRYVSSSVINEMLENPKRLKLGGEEKVLTVLFSDLEDFTTYSERFPPNEMVNILNDYFTEMTDQIFAYQGTLKEYVADEVMAIFGAPLNQADHAEKACAAALSMQERLRSLRQEWSDMGRPALRARTGINSGRMLAGNLGSTYRFSYGVLGDQVNLSSRLEGLNKLYGTEVLIGENTARLVEGSFILRELDQVRVKGKKKPVRVYELVARSEVSLPPDREQAFSYYAAGLEAYRQQRWEQALINFKKVNKLWPEDKANKLMAERCQVYQRVPPKGEWDGIFRERRK